MADRYSLAPFFALTGWTMNAVTKAQPCNGYEYRQRVERGVTERTADRLAVAAGFHPSLIWPEWEEHGTRACGRCGTPYMPVRRKQKWCSKRCRDAEAQREHQRRRWANDPVWAEGQRERLRRYRADVAAARNLRRAARTNG